MNLLCPTSSVVLFVRIEPMSPKVALSEVYAARHPLISQGGPQKADIPDVIIEDRFATVHRAAGKA